MTLLSNSKSGNIQVIIGDVDISFIIINAQNFSVTAGWLKKSSSEEYCGFSPANDEFVLVPAVIKVNFIIAPRSPLF